jgi:DNA (cytosine-5)-methyltransferase 1
MRYLSVCSGIEAATCAWHPLGWSPVAFSEIDKFPSAVLAHHYPTVPNWGDMSKFQEWPDANVDVLVGGTPCQSFSVAGLRKGLADPRGNLMLTYLAIAERYRPEWLVWENVPGVLSSNKGRDFGTFLGALGELGYGWAYRVLDAQYFGVAQRRRRVFVVANARGWQRAAAVLFERASLSGHPAPRREAGEGLAPSLAARTQGGGGLSTDAELDGALIQEIANPLTARMHKGVNTTCDEGQTMIAHTLRASSNVSEDGTGRGVPLVLAWNKELNARLELSGAILRGGDGDRHAGVAVPVAHAFDARQSDVIQYGDKTGPLDTDGSSIAVMPAVQTMAVRRLTQTERERLQTFPVGLDEEQNALVEGFGTLKARRESGGFQGAVMTPTMAVRRLTPRECERLQGFPDDYTLVPYRGKPAADGPRYKALGNSMAVPVMAWIGKRIQMVADVTATTTCAEVTR